MSLPFLQPHIGLSSGLNTLHAPSSGWTFEETFTDDQSTLDARWTQSGTLCKPVAATDDFVWTGLRVSTNHAMSHAITDVSDTAWVLRLKLDPISLSPGSYSSYFGWGMKSSSASSDSLTSSDSLMMSIRTRSGDPVKYYFEHKNNQPWANPQMSGNLFTNAPTTDARWYEITRLTATTATAKVFTDTYTTLLEQKAGVTISSSTIDLDHIIIQNDNNGDIGGVFNGTGDDIQFANGVTVAP